MTRERKGKSLLSFPASYVALDIETTGLDPRFNEIIELAAVKIENGAETARFQTLVKPKEEIDEFITALTGITNDMVRDAPAIADVLPAFLSFVGESVVVGHNVNFDVNFLYDNAEALRLPPFSNDFADTMRISRRLYPNLKNHKLSTLISHFGVGDTVEHRALSDCLRTQQCFEKMREYAATLDYDFWGHSNLRSKDITPETEEFDPDSPIYGMTFVFTGALERMTRREAMQAVVNAGGICKDGVSKKVNYLVLGNLDYANGIKGGKSAKQKAAEKLQLSGADIAVISENVFYDMLGEKNAFSEESPSEVYMYQKMELDFLESIRPPLKAAIEAQNGPGYLLYFNARQEYSAAQFRTFTIFRFRMRKTQQYFSIPALFDDLIPESFPKKRLQSQPDFIRLPIDEEHPPESYVDFLSRIAGETVNRYPKSWDCCSRYLECSDAGKCVHPDRIFALDCGYRKILASGRIFYGQRRNID